MQHSMALYVMLAIDAMLVTNVVFAQFLGICPFLGVSRKIGTAVGMGAAVIFVMTLATLVTFPLQEYVLEPRGLGYLQTIVFILVIASFVQLVEIVMKKMLPPLYRALGIFLPLITTNCAILGVAILAIRGGVGPLEELNLLQAVVFAATSGAGFLIALLIFAGIRERLDRVDVPKAMAGAPIALITAGILSLAFMGFSGLGK